MLKMRGKSKLLSLLFKHKGRILNYTKKDGIAETLTKKTDR